jgi:hypothetical protein
MPDETQDYVIKTAQNTYRIRAPKGMEQDKVLALAAGTNEKFASEYSQVQAHLKSREPIDKLKERQTAYSVFTPTGISNDPHGGQIRGTPEQVEATRRAQKNVTEGTLGAAGGELIAGIPALAGAPKVVQALASAGGTGTGAATGALASGESPKEALKTGGTYAGSELGIRGLTALGSKIIGGASKWISSLIKPTEEQLAAPVMEKATNLAQLADKEENIRQAIVSAPKRIQQEVSAAYPRIQSPVKISAATETAAKEAGELGKVGASTPKGVAKLAQLQKNIETLEKYRQAVAANHPGTAAGAPLWDAEMDEALAALKNSKELPFEDVQKIRSSLWRAGRQRGGPNLPEPVYKALTDTRRTLTDLMQDTADSEGKLSELLSAEAKNRKFMDAFYNKGAPFKGVLQLREGSTGKTLQMLKNPRNLKAAQGYMKEFGISPGELQELLDRPGLAEDMKDVVRLKESPQGWVQEQVSQARQQSDKSVSGARIKTAGVLGGGAAAAGAGWELLKHLLKTGSGTGPGLMP